MRKAGSSTGAVIEVVAEGVPPGLGRADLRQAGRRARRGADVINAVKGVEIGEGFAAAALRGEDECRRDAHGRRPVTFAVQPCRRHPGRHLHRPAGRGAVRGQADQLDPDAAADRRPRSGAGDRVSTKGRHDPCVGIRAVPVGEAMMACVLADHLLRHRAQNPDAPTGPPAAQLSVARCLAVD